MSEVKIALAITQFLRAALPADAVAFHVPNEGRRTVHERSRFVASGGKAGIPDRWILWQGRAYCWEEKTATGALSPSQRKTFPQLKDAGFDVPLVRSVEDAQRCLLDWGIPLRAALSRSAAAPPRPRTRSVARTHTA